MTDAERNDTAVRHLWVQVLWRAASDIATNAEDPDTDVYKTAMSWVMWDPPKRRLPIGSFAFIVSLLGWDLAETRRAICAVTAEQITRWRMRRAADGADFDREDSDEGDE